MSMSVSAIGMVDYFSFQDVLFYISFFTTIQEKYKKSRAFFFIQNVQWRRKGMVRESKVLHKNPETSYVEEGFSVI